MKTSKEVKYMIGLYKKSNEICSTLEQWEKGKIFKISKRNPTKVKYNGKIYNSLNALRV